MIPLRLELDAETAERLRVVAIAEKRPMVWQAEVLLRQALGLPFPAPRPDPLPEPRAGKEDGEHAA